MPSAAKPWVPLLAREAVQELFVLGNQIAARDENILPMLPAKATGMPNPRSATFLFEKARQQVFPKRPISSKFVSLRWQYQAPNLYRRFLFDRYVCSCCCCCCCCFVVVATAVVAILQFIQLFLLCHATCHMSHMYVCLFMSFCSSYLVLLVTVCCCVLCVVMARLCYPLFIRFHCAS